MEEAANQPAVPPMVSPRHEHQATVIASGRRRTLVLHPTADSWHYLVRSASLLVQFEKSYPLTEEGWRIPWQEFYRGDPDAAHEYFPESEPLERKLKRQELEAVLAEPVLGRIDGLYFIGGYGEHQLRPERQYGIQFHYSALQITLPPSSDLVIRYSEMRTMNVDGPGRQTTGGGYVGGGFGLGGVLEGALIASVLNRITIKTTVKTFFELQDKDRYLAFMSDKYDVSELKILLKPVLARMRDLANHESTVRVETGGSVVDGIERLARLRADGVLTDDEFQAAKRSLLEKL